MARESYADRARRGAALLDRAMPGWFKKIDLDTLALSSCSDCICGQIARKTYRSRKLRSLFSENRHAPWWATIEWLRRKGGRPTVVDVFEHGFTAHTSYGYHILDKEWGKLVRERLERAAA